MTHRWLRGAHVVLLLCAFLTACRLEAQSADGGFERTLGVSGPVTLDIRTGSGSIEMRRGSVDSVVVTARIRGRSLTGGDLEQRIRRIESAPPVEQAGNSIRIGHVQDDQLFRNISISYVVTAPAATQVRSHTGSGSQDIDNLDGPVAVTAGSGRIVVRHVGREVRASTGSGAIEAEDVGSLIGRTGSGSITAQGVRGAVDARTGSGRVDVTQTADAGVDVVTASGGIEVRGARQALRAQAASGSIDVEGRPGEDWEVQSASGSIRIDFAEDSAFALDARTASGGISTSHPLTLIGSASRRQLRGTVRGGGPTVRVSTASGSIDIE